MPGMLQETALVCAQHYTWESKWIASCLPRAEAAVRKAPRLVDAVDDAVGISNYLSVMDATVAAIFPELREPMRQFYAGRGPALLDGYGAGAIARFDERLAKFAEGARVLSVPQVKLALAVLRAG